MNTLQIKAEQKYILKQWESILKSLDDLRLHFKKEKGAKR